MIRDAQEHNETITPNDFELERLRTALPEYFDNNGAFMIDRLQETLRAGDVNLTKEGYELKFLGKSYAKYLTSTETETVVVPDLKHNSEPDNEDSKNLYIVGDNLDALKHLLGSYAGQVKCIYIDPPYNTGSDGFVYNDDFGFTPKQLIDKIGLSEEEAQRVLDLQGKSSHSAWLTFMYPRLQLARELLCDDGVIFISIDDNEQSNLKLLCDEVFGEQGFIGQLIRSTNPKGRSQDMYVANNHEYLLAYSRTVLQKGAVSIAKSQAEVSKDYPLHDEEGRAYRELELRNTHREFGRHNRPNLFYPFYVSSSGKVQLEKSTEASLEVLPIWGDGFEGCWTWSKELARRDLHLLVAREVNGQWKIYRKAYGHNGDEAVKKQVKSLWTESDMRTERGQQCFDELFDARDKLFQAPKPPMLIERILRMSTSKSSLVVDFFSGSGTTAEAVTRLNSEDGGSRKFVMVQLPEAIAPDKPAYDAGYRTIDQIGRERIQRAAAKIKEETSADIDYGFRLYRLEEPSGQVLDQLESFDPEQADALFAGDYVSKFDLDGTSGHDTMLATWLVKDGHGLTATPERVKLAGYELDVCGDSAYIINTGLTSEDVVALVRMLENGELTTSRVVVFGYSVEFSVMHELKKNLAVLKSGKTVSVIERF